MIRFLLELVALAVCMIAFAVVTIVMFYAVQLLFIGFDFLAYVIWGNA